MVRIVFSFCRKMVDRDLNCHSLPTAQALETSGSDAAVEMASCYMPLDARVGSQGDRSTTLAVGALCFTMETQGLHAPTTPRELAMVVRAHSRRIRLLHPDCILQ